jgi:HEAT repeat protein
MKKICLLVSEFLLFSLVVLAQAPSNRSSKTIVADVLAQMPAEQTSQYYDQIKELSTTGEEGVLQLVGRLNPPGQGSNAPVEFALSGWANYVTGEGLEAVRLTTVNALAKSLEQVTDPYNKAFVISLIGIAGKEEVVATLKTYLSDASVIVSGAAARALTSINGPAVQKIPMPAKTGAQHERIAALGIQMAGKPDNALKLLQTALKNPDRKYRYAALSFASEYANEGMYSTLIQSLAKAKPEVQLDIIHWLGDECNLPDKRELITKIGNPTLINMLSTNDFELKTAVAQILVKTGGEQAIQALAGLLNATDEKTIDLGYQTLLTTKGNISDPVVSVIATANDAGKIAGLKLLAHRKADQHVDVVQNLINTGSADVQAAAQTALKDMFASEYTDRGILLSMTGENRRLQLTQALETADTDVQKNELLEQLGKTNSFLGLLLAAQYLDTPALQQRAAVTVMNLALNNNFTGKNVKDLLNKIMPILNNQDADYQRQAIRKYLSEMPDEEGFISIFNGKDLTGWKGLVGTPLTRPAMKTAALAKAQKTADEQMRKDWIVENGLLAYVGTGYDNICTTKDYGDIEMYLDWRLDPAGTEPDAGIYLRGTPQVQIWDISRTNVGAEVGSGGLYNNQINSSKPDKVADNELGAWNTMYIKMIGDRVTVKLNGELVVNNVMLENYWDRSQPIPALEQIELQAHGSKVWYRNIYVKELDRPAPYQLSAQEKKDGFKILFDGTNMHEWKGNTVDYRLEDGCISLYPSNSWGGNLYTVKEYGNFIFRFEFQLTPSANNGVGIRAEEGKDAAYYGMEIQILDCEHPVYNDIAPYQHHGSVYGVIAAEHGAMNPVGEWNYEEIYANGDHIKVTLNGKVIVDGNIREAAKNGTVDHNDHPGLFNKTGYIGFLGHGSYLKFKNIRIKELP